LKSVELEIKQGLYIHLTIGCKIPPLNYPSRLPYPSLLNSENTNTSQISAEEFNFSSRMQELNVLVEIVI
jgi:hypothetical protein